MDLYFKGLSYRKIANTIYQFYDIKIHHETVRRWIKTFMAKMNKYVSNLKVEHSNIWLVDEQKVKTKKDREEIISTTYSIVFIFGLLWLVIYLLFRNVIVEWLNIDMNIFLLSLFFSNCFKFIMIVVLFGI